MGGALSLSRDESTHADAAEFYQPAYDIGGSVAALEQRRLGFHQVGDHLNLIWEGLRYRVLFAGALRAHH
jgi:hypothetical protein